MFLLTPTNSRSENQWAATLGPLRDEQLVPARVVKDAGTGLKADVAAVWPSIEEHDDLFYVVYLMDKLAVRLERRVYRDIEAVFELLRKRTTARVKSLAQR